jgi:SAM-dependent methyltransferase
VSDSESKLVENLLAKPDVHRQWASGYRTPDNERFFEAAFDLVASVLKPPPGATVLDVGCGSCAHSVRLARRGFQVRAVDFSESALKMAAEHLRAQGLEDRVTLGRENILDLSFPDGSFDYVVCWGVLMHVPDVGRAVSELARVVRPGGHLVISEGNMHSLEATALRAVKRLFGQEKAEVKRTPAGVEFWKASGDAALVTRQSDVGWLARAFGGHGLRLVRRAAGQFSEAYAMAVPGPLKRAVHGVNNFWFRSVREPRLAYGNILFFRKSE